MEDIRMEATDCTKIVFNKIQKFDPDNVIKIIGYLLLHHAPQDLFNFALASDAQILSLINEAKFFFSFPPTQTQQTQQQQQPTSDHSANLNFTHAPAVLSRSFSSPSSFRVPVTYNWDPHLHFDHHNPQVLQSQHVDFQTNFTFPGSSPSSVCHELPAKTCQYYHKGFCKHGASCWYLHGGSNSNSNSNSNANANASRVSLNEFTFNEEVSFALGSLDNLEMEIRELLKMRSGLPLSIASLPLFYYDKYGKALQAEGYLTESQRHGKSGFSLTKLLTRLNNGIRLIQGQNGQHMVILAEDAHKYGDNKSDRYHQGGVNASSNQIYLTFPAESTFTDEDVENYFKQYGPVHDVRIPHQEKRMFGFVSFIYPETVRHILAKGNPHYICGSRVLVKPYKEKSKLIDRKNAEKTMFSSNSLSRFYEMDQNPKTTSRVCNYSEIFKKQLIEEREIEIESNPLFDLQLTPNKPTQEHFFGSGVEELNYIEDQFSNLSIVPKNPLSGGKNDDMTRQMSNNRNENNIAEIDLPESPFASPL